MGDIVKEYKVKSEDVQPLNLYFDSGSPFTFVKMSAAKRIGGVLKLPYSFSFNGLGDGQFFSNQGIHIEVELLGIWCRHFAYVVDEGIIDEDILIGHDFMQKYDIKLDMKKRELIIDKNALLRDLKVRYLCTYKVTGVGG